MHYNRDGILIVSAPVMVPLGKIEDFVNSHADWIEKHKPGPEAPQARLSHSEFESVVLSLINRRCSQTGISLPKVTFNNARSYWGICYPEKHLVKFSYRGCVLSDSQIDYVVVHELCHFVHTNHGKEFWNLVEKYVPDRKSIRKSMKSLC